MKKQIKISEAEYKVLNVIWEESPITGNEIINILSDSSDWKPNTIRTLIARLAEKEVLQRKKKGKEYEYLPLLSREECIREEKESFLNRFFDGALMPMLAHFINEEELTPENIEELKKALKNKNRS